MRCGCCSRWVRLGFCATLVVAAVNSTIFAQDEGQRETTTLPQWVVLVLEPISTERVRPVTGVVISASGLVIVPIEFAAPGDQIIVLDGGTDIIRNGRAATVQTQLQQAGLTVLSAPGLKRQPARLSASALQDGDTIHLAAFPPAEMISEGAAPLSVPTRVKVPGPVAASGPLPQATSGIAMVNPLPNVTGPLLDGCGNLVGFSSADGVQSMETSMSPAYLWKEGLLAALATLAVTLPEGPCPVPMEPAAEALPVTGEAEQDSAPEGPASTPVAREAARHTADTIAPLPRKVSSARPHWLSWFTVLGVLLLGSLLWWRIRRRLSAAPAVESLLTEPMAQVSPIRASPDQGNSQADSVLEISGNLENGTPFQASCKVNSAAIDVVIGRGAVDLKIDSQGIQREHARLSGSGDLLTLTDLGSSRGTWINRVPCLKGEIMYVGEADTVFLGGVSFRISIRPVNS